VISRPPKARGNIYGPQNAFFQTALAVLRGGFLPLCDTATNNAWLIVVRAVHGIGEVVSPRWCWDRWRSGASPGSELDIRPTTRTSCRVRVVAGPILGGVIVDQLRWRGFFYPMCHWDRLCVRHVAAGLNLATGSSPHQRDLRGSPPCYASTQPASCFVTVVGTVLLHNNGDR